MDKRRFAGLRWPGSTRVVVFGQGLAIIIWPSESGDHESGNQALFNTRKLALNGNSVPLAEQVTANEPSVYGVFSASNSGVLVLHAGGGTGSGLQLVWFDRGGKPLGQVVSGTDLFPNPALSPDGSRLAYSLFDNGKADIWGLWRVPRLSQIKLP